MRKAERGKRGKDGRRNEDGKRKEGKLNGLF
jgi:hypothetical protein